MEGFPRATFVPLEKTRTSNMANCSSVIVCDILTYLASGNSSHVKPEGSEGAREGERLGLIERDRLGDAVGFNVGCFEGEADGGKLGETVGLAVGAQDGLSVSQKL